MAVAQIRSLDGFRAERRLAAVLRGNESLSASLQAAQESLRRYTGDVDLAAWDEVVLGLLDANLGDGVVRAFLQLSEQWPRPHAVGDLLERGLGRCGAAVSGWRGVAAAAGQEPDQQASDQRAQGNAVHGSVSNR